MKLFSKENDLIKRILNLILIVWLITTIVIAYTSLVDVFFENKNLSYEDFKIRYCTNRQEIECKNDYEIKKINNKQSANSNKKTLVNSVGNFFIVGTFLIIVNYQKR